MKGRGTGNTSSPDFLLFCNLNSWYCSLGKDILKKSENMIFWGQGKKTMKWIKTHEPKLRENNLESKNALMGRKETESRLIVWRAYIIFPFSGK